MARCTRYFVDVRRFSAGAIVVALLAPLLGCGGNDQPEGLTGNPDDDEEQVEPAANGNGRQPATPNTPSPAGNTTGAPVLLAPQGAPKNSSPPSVPAVAIEESPADRAATEWVLSVGGRVGADRSGAWLRAGSSLPTAPFRVVRVDLHDCDPGKEGLEKLSGLSQLEELDVSESMLSDDRLAQLTQAPALLTLKLQDTSVTDIGVKHLQTLKTLKRVELPAAVSDAAVADLKAALPGCEVAK